MYFQYLSESWFMQLIKFHHFISKLHFLEQFQFCSHGKNWSQWRSGLFKHHHIFSCKACSPISGTRRKRMTWIMRWPSGGKLRQLWTLKMLNTPSCYLRTDSSRMTTLTWRVSWKMYVLILAEDVCFFCSWTSYCMLLTGNTQVNHDACLHGWTF